MSFSSSSSSFFCTFFCDDFVNFGNRLCVDPGRSCKEGETTFAGANERDKKGFKLSHHYIFRRHVAGNFQILFLKTQNIFGNRFWVFKIRILGNRGFQIKSDSSILVSSSRDKD